MRELKIEVVFNEPKDLAQIFEQIGSAMERGIEGGDLSNANGYLVGEWRTSEEFGVK